MTAVAEYTVAPRVREFLSEPRRLYIGDGLVDAASGGVFAPCDPASGDKLVDVAHGGAEDIDRAVRAARAAFDHGPWPATSTHRPKP